MMSWWHWLARGLLELLSPGCCHLCGQHIPQVEQVFCDSCRRKLLTDPKPSCPRCAATIGPHAYTADGCFHCRTEKFPFKQALRLGSYEQEKLHELVLRLKHPSGEFLARLIIRLWLERDLSRFEALDVDVVVPVPSHWWRRLERGYDQVATLARELASQLRLPCERSWLYRKRHTKRQVEKKSRQERKDNVHKAFAVREGLNLKDRRILLIDDVMTTGATLKEAAGPLVDAGAARVVVAVLARTSAPS